MLVAAAIYLIGTILAYLMQRTEIRADKEPYTIGDRLLVCSLSLLSFVFVTIILVKAWVKQIALTGFWEEPVEKPVVIEQKINTKKSTVLN